MAIYTYRNVGTNQIVHVNHPDFDGNSLWELVSVSTGSSGGGGGDVTEAELDAELADLADDLVPRATLTSKGDMYAASGAGTPVRVGVGSDQLVLTADSNAPAGVRWGSVPDTVTVLNARSHGAVGTAIPDETALIQDLLASTWPYPRQLYMPTGDYKISGTLTPGQSSSIVGDGYEATRFWPVTGMSVPLFDLGETPGTKLRGFEIAQGGSAGVPAVRMGGQQQHVSDVVIRQWAGHGIDAAVQNFSTIRNVNVANMGGDGIRLRTTYTLVEGTTVGGCGGNGYVLQQSDFNNGSGVLVGCTTEGNSGHGVLVTGGDWDLQIWGESNLGDLIHVDGTQRFDAQITLTANAAENATTLTITALTKGLPDRGILRFADGTAVVVNVAGGSPTSLVLRSPLRVAQTSGAVATLAPEDIPPGLLPTVRIRSGTHDGRIYLHACNYALETLHPTIGGNPNGDVVATASARMIGEPHVVTHTQATRTWGGGGSNALAAALGLPGPVVPIGLAHLATPVAEYQAYHSAGTNLYWQDDTVPGGMFLRLANQFNWVQTAIGWKASSLTPGTYTVRALVRNTARTANGITMFVYGGPTRNYTTRTTDWEWINLDFTQTAASRLLTTDGVFVQRAGVTEVDVAAIVIVPRADHLVLPASWTNPTWLGSTTSYAAWVDAGGVLRLSSATPTADTTSDIALAPGRISIGQVSVRTGTGSPEGAVTAPVGSLYLRTDGSAGTVVYAKEAASGNTGWTAHAAGGGGGSAGTTSFRVSYLDIPKDYGSTTWVYSATPSNGAALSLPDAGPPYFGGYNLSGGSTPVEELSYDVDLAGGTWSLYLFGLSGPNGGDVTVLIDGTESTAIDSYHAGNYNRILVPALTGVAVTAGAHVVTVRKKGTSNASSSGTYAFFSGLMGVRTGP